MTNPHDPKATPACDESLNERAASERRAYERPQLTVLGSVRELTRASGGSSGDGGIEAAQVTEPDATAAAEHVREEPLRERAGRDRTSARRSPFLARCAS